MTFFQLTALTHSVRSMRTINKQDFSKSHLFSSQSLSVKWTETKGSNMGATASTPTSTPTAKARVNRAEVVDFGGIKRKRSFEDGNIDPWFNNDDKPSVDRRGLDRSPSGSFSLRDEGNVHLCSASLIQPLLLLTAAHCVLGKSLKGMKAMRAGGPTLDLINVTQVIIHPNFDLNTLNNDIAVLRLDPNDSHQYDSSTDGIFPTLPPSTSKVPQTAILTGWDLKYNTTQGKQSSPVFHSYRIRTFRRPDCLALYESDDRWNRTITENMFCAWYVGKDSCQEIESGGVLFCGTDTPYICGIGSWGYGCGSDDILPMVYTKVSKYVPWIEMHIRN